MRAVLLIATLTPVSAVSEAKKQVRRLDKPKPKEQNLIMKRLQVVPLGRRTMWRDTFILICSSLERTKTKWKPMSPRQHWTEPEFHTQYGATQADTVRRWYLLVESGLLMASDDVTRVNEILRQK
jgi:hypothetical protein